MYIVQALYLLYSDKKLIRETTHVLITNTHIGYFLQRSESSAEQPAPATTEESEPAPADPDDIILQTDISQWLVLKGPSKDGPEVRGGHPDALIVLATKATKGKTFERSVIMFINLSLG